MRTSRLEKNVSKTVRSQLKKQVVGIFKDITDNFSNRDMVNLIKQHHVTRVKAKRKARI